MSFGGSKTGGGRSSSSSEGGGFSRGGSTSGQEIWGGQSPFLQQLFSGAQGAVGQASQNYNQMQPGMMEAFQSLMNPGVNPQLEAYSGQVQENFQNNILPGINSAAVGANAIGGSRTGVAEGVAAGMANRDVSNMAANLYGQDRDRMMQTMGMGGQVAGAGLSPYQQLAQILGGPTTLSSSDAWNKSKQWNTSTSKGKKDSGWGITGKL